MMGLLVLWRTGEKFLDQIDPMRERSYRVQASSRIFVKLNLGH